MSRLLFAVRPAPPAPPKAEKRLRRASRFWTWLLLGVVREDVERTTKGPGKRRGVRRSRR